MGGTIVNFIDNTDNDSVMIQFDRIMKPIELQKIQKNIKNHIKNCLEKKEYFIDDKKMVTQILNEMNTTMNFKWKVIQTAEYNITF